MGTPGMTKGGPSKYSRTLPNVKITLGGGNNDESSEIIQKKSDIDSNEKKTWKEKSKTCPGRVRIKKKERTVPTIDPLDRIELHTGASLPFHPSPTKNKENEKYRATVELRRIITT